MNVLFVCHNELSSNSGIHVSNLARWLSELGADVLAAVPDGMDRTVPAGHRYRSTSYSGAAGFRFRDGMGADLIHAWTPRQHVAKVARELSRNHRCPYVVHLEDDEHTIAARFLGLNASELLERVSAGSAPQIPAFLADPGDMRSFLAGSIGVTALIGTLFDFKPDNVPGLEIWPAAEDDLFYPRPGSQLLRDELGIASHTKTLVYHGNVHPANLSEVRSLYLAVAALARRNVDVVLVRLGRDSCPILPDGLAEAEFPVVSVPFQPRERLPDYLAIADVFVQPGKLDDFNAYRFPSKLPEFFAMERPVVLPATNIGLRIADFEEGILIQRGDALELADKILRVVSDPDLSARLAKRARVFYDRTLSWKKSAIKLMDFYNGLNLPTKLDDLKDNVALKGLAKHYRGYSATAMLSYATVRDYSDSMDHMRALSTINQDLKDAQRPWVMKAVLGSVPKGGRLLEIGAGDPWVADLLARLGYEVVIVDPYDGRDRGPAGFEEIKRQFPQITFLRGTFPDALVALDNARFDCIYSIFVLEHLEEDAIADVFAGISRHSRTKNSPTIHAIDHVLLGNGADTHFARLKKMVECLGFDECALRDMLEKLRNDSDTYFLSAEAHNRWRGQIPYDEFPMRRCVSIQLCAPAGGVLEADTAANRPRT